MHRASWAISVAAILGGICLSAPAGTIDYTEEFSLAADRAKALEQLIPGTDDYYYYHGLHYLNEGQLGKLPELMKSWCGSRKDYQMPASYWEIRNRYELLNYPNDPKQTLAFLTRRLNLHFHHQRDQLDPKSTLPSKLDEKLVSYDRLFAQALGRRHTLSGFTDAALYEVIDQAADKLDAPQRNELLRRLPTADVPNLMKLVVPTATNFGNIPIHNRLLRSQLDELVKPSTILEYYPNLHKDPDKRPARAEAIAEMIRNNTNYVHAYLRRLAPSADENPQFDPAVRKAHLDRLWAFAQTLGPVHNSLRAHVLYQRLVFARKHGQWPEDEFIEYLKLPRPVHYIERDWMKNWDRRRSEYANLGVGFPTGFVPIGNDEPLVRSYLLHLLRDAKDYTAYAKYVESSYLQAVLAEAKIVNGIPGKSGTLEDWYHLLTPAQYRALQQRIDIEFAYDTPEVFAVDETVKLKVHLKNVDKLMVKVFRINAWNYYRQTQAALTTAIDLDGLVPNSQETHEIDLPDLRRTTRTFEFPKLEGRGTWVIEFIGNGRASRAMIQKGQLRMIDRVGLAGQKIRVMDETNQPVDNATVWIGGHEYAPGKDDKGWITVPYSTHPGRRPIVLSDGACATLEHFNHLGESYDFRVGFHVERESLLAGGKAKLLVRPALFLNGEPVSTKLLEDVRLTIAAVDLNGVPTTQEVKDFKLEDGKDTVHEFSVPDRLQNVSFHLQARVKMVTKDTKIPLAAARTFALNQIDRTDKVDDLQLARTRDGWVVSLLGKNGEPKTARPIGLIFQHHLFTQAVHTALATDAAGQVRLGSLKDIDQLTATGPDGVQHQWTLLEDYAALPNELHGKAGRPVAVPYMGDAKAPTREELSLLELRSGQDTVDRFDALKIVDGLLLATDLPAGDYLLRYRNTNRTIRIRMTDGEPVLGTFAGKNRRLEVTNVAPLQIADVAVDDQTVGIRLHNPSADTRVLVLASRYEPAYGTRSDLTMPIPGVGMASLVPPQSLYVAGRDIGEEYRYVLDRQYAVKYPGNMLRRAGLILNPWEVRKTDTGRQTAAEGEEFARRAARTGAGAAGAGKYEHVGVSGQAGYANLDFLADGAAVLANLTPDKDGHIVIARADLGDCQQVRVVAYGSTDFVWKRVPLAATKLQTRDLRLARIFDPAKHYTQQKRITTLGKGESLRIDDVATSRLDVYGTFAQAYRLLRTLNGDAKMVEFAFLLGWDEYDDARKRELYTRYASHELHVFLYHKDRAFFDKVVRPFIACKADKTFLDHYVLEDKLTGYLEPWRYAQLNVAERALLGRRLADEQADTRRHIRELFELIPPNPDRYNQLFDTALRGRALAATAADTFTFSLGAEYLSPETVGIASGRLYTRDGHGIRTVDGALPVLADMPAPTAPMATPRPSRSPRSAAAPADQAERLNIRSSVTRRQAAELSAVQKDMDAKLGKVADKLELLEALDSDEDGIYEDAATSLGNEYTLEFREELAKRESMRRLYVAMEPTKEWAENNYYKLPIAAQNAGLIDVNGFWADYAQWDGKGAFVSTNLAEAAGNLPEMILALAVLDLPAKPAEHKADAKDAALTITAAGPVIVYHEEIRPADKAENAPPILVSQDFFRRDDRYRHVGNERFDKFVTEEFLPGVVYGAQIVVTNTTSSKQRLDLLLQIPAGAMPVLGGKYTDTRPVALDPFRTAAIEYYFYFPATGGFRQYPVNVAQAEKYVTSAEPDTFQVVEQLSKVDKTSWNWISQFGTENDVLAYLKANNLQRTNLSRIAWRMKDKAFYEKVLALLGDAHAYNATLWSYAVQHDDPARIQVYLANRPDFVNQVGWVLDSPLLRVDPVERRTFQYLEYFPLVNARVHQLGKDRQIVNEAVFQQYNRLLKVLTYAPKLDDEAELAAAYYLFLQDRVAEALAFFGKVDAGKLPTKVQYDYFTVYAAFYRADTKTARRVAETYKEYPVDHWRNRFANALAQLDEITGGGPKVVDDEDAAQVQAKLAATSPSLDLAIEDRKVKLTYANVSQVKVHYYKMDIELLFSRSPFVQKQTDRFSYIEPNRTATIDLPKAQQAHTFDLPKELANSNVLVEVEADGIKKAQPYFANSLGIQMFEQYGQVKVTDQADAAPLAKVYVKVYAQTADGRVIFYKDGYTDLRGRFDYSSVNTGELNRIRKFSLLILSETHGAVVREAAPPQQ